MAAVALLSVFVVTILTNGMSASAYWKSSGTGTGTSVTGTLLAPTTVTVPSTSTKNVAVSWTASAGAVAPTGYYLTRTSGSTTVAACPSSPAALLTTTSCTDANVPDGSHAYTVTAIYRSWTARSAPSSSVTVMSPTKLAFAVQPSNTIAGAAISPAVTVALQTAASVAVPLAGVSITLTLSSNPGSGTLSGTLTAVTDSAGRVAFAGLSLDKAAAGYALTAASVGLASATSSAFTITAGSAAKLVYTTTPVSGVASAASIMGPITVQRQDQYGNPVTASAATISLASSSAGVSRFSTTSSGTAITSVSIPNGSSTTSFYYGDTKAGTPTLTASSTGLVAATQSATVTPGTAKLVFGQQPTNTPRASVIAPITVNIVDTFGNTVTSSTATVSIAIKNNPSFLDLASMTGTMTNSAVSGVATFNTLSINSGWIFFYPAVAQGYTLEATSANLVSVTSTAFDITN